jgi:hypothetical protein
MVILHVVPLNYSSTNSNEQHSIRGIALFFSTEHAITERGITDSAPKLFFIPLALTGLWAVE